MKKYALQRIFSFTLARLNHAPAGAIRWRALSALGFTISTYGLIVAF
jgi:hypothetical protein